MEFQRERSMRNEDFADFSETLMVTGDVFGKPVSDAVIKFWWTLFQPFEIDDFKRAMALHVTNTDKGGTFMPKPADIIRLIEGANGDLAAMAWAKVDRAWRTIGHMQSVVFDDPVIHAVLSDMGGWAGLMSRNSNDSWPFVAREFEDRYRAYKVMRRVPVYPAVLKGVEQIENDANGYSKHNNPPRLIGDVQQARQVLIGGMDAPHYAVAHIAEVRAIK